MSLVTSVSTVESRRAKTRTLHFDAALPPELIDAFWHEPESVAARSTPLQCKSNRRALLLDWHAQRYVLKHYMEATWQDKLKHSLEPSSRAWRSWFASHKLADAGIRTPRPVICLENSRSGLRRDSFMMYPYVEGRTLTSVFSGTVNPKMLGNIWQQLRQIWARLADIRMSLTDTNVRNFILAPDGNLWVIDLDRTKRHWSSSRVAATHRRGWARLLKTAELARKKAA